MLDASPVCGDPSGEEEEGFASAQRPIVAAPSQRGCCRRSGAEAWATRGGVPGAGEAGKALTPNLVMFGSTEAAAASLSPGQRFFLHHRQRG